MTKSSNINITVNLDGNKHPESIFWEAQDSDDPRARKEVKAILLSLFDKDHLDTLKIDLWTKEMQVVEMDRFMFQTLRALSDTYFKATNNAELANAFAGFADYFGEKTGILSQEKEL